METLRPELLDFENAKRGNAREAAAVVDTARNFLRFMRRICALAKARFAHIPTLSSQSDRNRMVPLVSRMFCVRLLRIVVAPFFPVISSMVLTGMMEQV